MIGLEVSVQLLEQATRYGITIDQDSGVITISEGEHAGRWTVATFLDHPEMPHDLEGRHTVWLRPA